MSRYDTDVTAVGNLKREADISVCAMSGPHPEFQANEQSQGRLSKQMIPKVSFGPMVQFYNQHTYCLVV
jgi:hypothetical protein